MSNHSQDATQFVLSDTRYHYLPAMFQKSVGEFGGPSPVAVVRGEALNDTLNVSSLSLEDEDLSSSYSYWSYYSYDSIMMGQEGLDTWMPIVLFTAVFLIGVPANALVIFVLARNGAFRSNINVYLLNLAAVDFVFLTIVIPTKLNTYIVSSRDMWHLGQFMCKLSIYVLYVNMTVSILTLVALAVNRYNAVMHPVTCHSNRSKAHAILTIVAIWVVTLASQSPSVVVADTVTLMMTHNLPTVVCAESWPNFETMRAFKGSNFVLFYCIPLVVVSVCYFKMALTLQRSTHFTRAESGQSGLGGGLLRQQTSRRKVARMVYILVLAFAVCMLPWHVLMFISCTPSIALNHTVSFYLGIFCRLAVYVNPCLNPLLYSFFSENFRANLRKSCLCLSKIRLRKKIFTPLGVRFNDMAMGFDESARTSGASGQQRSLTSNLTRAF